MPVKISALRQQRAAAFDTFAALANKPMLNAEERSAYSTGEAAVRDLDDQIERAVAAQALAGTAAVPVAGQEQRSVPAAVENSVYLSDEAARRWADAQGMMPGGARSIVFGGMVKMAGAGGGSLFLARQESATIYGPNHPVTRALNVTVGSAGGFAVPPDFMPEIIELLRAVAVVRASGPRVIPMPRGTMTMPGQNSAASATYGTELANIPTSQPGLDQIVASFKKLTSLVPVSNDMMRYADPAADAFVRDDMVKVIALAEDYAFIMRDGSSAAPRGFLSFANGSASRYGGTAGLWLATGNSTAAVNGSTGGNFISSTGVFTLATVAAELGGAVNKLDTANVPENRRIWYMHPRSYNYLNNVQNSIGVYVYRDELSKGTLLGYPVKKTTQIPTNIYTTTGNYTDCSFVFLVEMTEAMLFDSMSLELAVSREGTYVDGSGTMVSAFQKDQTLIRGISEHDLQMRHDESIAVIQFVRWAPAIS